MTKFDSSTTAISRALFDTLQQPCFIGRERTDAQASAQAGAASEEDAQAVTFPFHREG